MDVDRPINTNMFTADPTIPVQILVIANMLMLSHVIMVMIHHHMLVEVIRASTNWVSATNG